MGWYWRKFGKSVPGIFHQDFRLLLRIFKFYPATFPGKR